MLVEYLLMELGKRQKQNGAGLAPFCIASVVASDSICVSAGARRNRPPGRRIPVCCIRRCLLASTAASRLGITSMAMLDRILAHTGVWFCGLSESEILCL